MFPQKYFRVPHKILFLYVKSEQGSGISILNKNNKIQFIKLNISNMSYNIITIILQ